MSQFLIATLIAASTCLTGYAQTKGSGATSTSKAEQEIRELNRAWAAAVATSDASALDRIFADDLIVTSGSGVIRSKTEEIKDATAGSDPDFVSLTLLCQVDSRFARAAAIQELVLFS